MASIIVGAVGVLVRPIAKGINKSVENSFSGAPAVAEKVGRSMGRSMNRAFSASKPVDVERATKSLQRAQEALAGHTERSALRQRKAQEDVAKARQNVADVATTSSEKVQKAQAGLESAEADLARVVEQSARDQEAAKRKVEQAEAELGRTVEQSARDQEAAKRRVDAAQRDYNETVAEYGAESAQAQAAADRLADAEDKLAKAVSDGASRQERAKERVTDAQERLARVTEEGALKQERAQRKVTDAQEAYSRAVEESGKDSDAARRAADDLAIAEENLKTAAMEAAQGHQTLEAEVAEAKRALDEAERSSRGLSRAWQGAKDFGADYKGMGNRLNAAIGPKVWRGIKLGVLGVAGTITGVLGTALVKGWGRLTSLENAESTLRGLGHTGENVQSIMDNALAAVKGTAFGMDEAAGTAAVLVGAGVKPGEGLEKTLRLIGDAATIGGSSLDEMGSIFGKVAARGSLNGEVMQQLLDRNIGLLPQLAEHYGVTNEAAQKMVSDGKVSFEDFSEVMEKTLGGAALEAGNTTQGAFKNMGASMGRFGAALLKDIFPLVAPLFGKVTELFDYLTDAAGPAIESVVERLKPFAESMKNVFDLLVTGDFKGGIFSLEEDSPFIGFLFTVREVAIELWEKALKPLGTWIGQNWPVIAAAVGGLIAYLGGSMLIAAIGSIGSALGAVLGSATVIGGAIATVVGALVGFFTQTETGQELLGRFVSFVRDTLRPGVVGAFEAIRDFVVDELWPMLKSRFEAIRDLALQVWDGVIRPAFEQFTGYLRDTFFPIVQRLWTEYVQPVFLAIGAAAVWLWENAVKPAMSALDHFIGNVLGPVIIWLWENVVSPAFSAIGEIIDFAWNKVIFPALDALKYFLFEVLPPAFQWLWDTAKTVWDGIKTTIHAVVDWFQTWVWPVIELVIELIKLGFRTMRDVLRTVWFAVRDNVIRPVVNWFRDTAWPMISRVIDSIKTGFDVMKSAIDTAWSFVKDRVINPVATWFRDTIKPLFDTTTTGVGDAFTSMKDSVKKAWDAIKSTAKAPIKFVVQTVLNDALIGNFNKVAKKLGTSQLPTVSLPAGFARGGILPGSSSWRDGDDQIVAARRGEGWMVSEGLRDPLSRSLFLAANSAARTNGTSFADFLRGHVTGGFAGGGIVDWVKDTGSKAWKGTKKAAGTAKDLAGHALDKVLDGVDFVAEALRDPAGIFKKVYDAVIGKIPAAGLVTDVAKASGKRVLDGAIAKVKEMIAPSIEMPDLSGIKAGGSLAMARSIARSFGLTMTSFRRGGARTAGSGSVSLHALGRAMDFSNSSGPTPQMMGFFNAMHAFRPTELLYSPAGARQWRRGGYMADTSGATKRMHYNHVHVGFNRGGIVDQRPTLFDQGGILPPGLTGVLNATKKPEAVLTNEQLQQLRTLTSRDPASGDTFVVNAQNDRAQELVSELMWAQKTRRRRGRYAHAGR
ncbi:phage tail protein [Brachybacterium massiliense]|uniref:phage tail protein n=1 Tax=Brachybacterium massiliense TaxID=1755098 RepID=UPI001121E097|nr:tape measure protein [Brachybacterium massiliense]